jgi:hypothetical protein
LPEIDIDICGRGLDGHAFLLRYLSPPHRKQLW